MIKLVPKNTTKSSEILNAIRSKACIVNKLPLCDFWIIYANANTPNGSTKWKAVCLKLTASVIATTALFK